MRPEFSLRCRVEGGGTPVLSQWGADCEYGVLRDVLLGPVDHYRWLETSSVSRKSIRRHLRFDGAVARQQHAEMICAYQSAGVTVHFHHPDPALPYQIFARDSSVMTPYGAMITNMANWWRRGENFRCMETYQRLGIPIYDYVTAGTFEGGDFNVIEPGSVLIGWAGEGGRSQECAAAQLKAWLAAEGWEVKLTDIDPLVVMLAPKLAAVCLESTDPDVVAWLQSKAIEIITVPFQETLALGCNVVALGHDRILMPESSTTLKEKARAHGLTVFDPDMSGGAGIETRPRIINIRVLCGAVRRSFL